MSTTLLNSSKSITRIMRRERFSARAVDGSDYIKISSARVSRDSRENTNRATAHGWMLTIERRGATAAVTRIYLSTETTKGDQQMKTKLDSMNHRQRAAFARSLYHRPTMARNPVTAASAYGIKGAK